ncbi:uncharacterized protein LOC124896601 [Capsicum annuum]|uniref:uncharacterized protein LOC124896601 n=1 Tax=Capsicum annuum TaxID=4072 RepID=UPI001FB141FB|nr:uncharacterized protein LOC124896601 [Capsicum annuum]
MTVALRYFFVNERVIAIVRVGDTSTKTLMKTICFVLMRHSLSISKRRGQGYDGASNMQGEMNAVSKKYLLVDDFFVVITNVLDVVGASFKRRDQLRDHQAEMLEQLLESGEILVMSNELSASLQRKEQDIVNAMIFLDITKTKLQLLRDDGWNALMNEVRVCCDKHENSVPKMDDFYLPEKSKCRTSSVTYSHHLRVELFYAIINLQLQELNNRFDVVSGNLLIGMILAKHYPNEFGESKLRELSYQLDTFIIHMRHDDPIFFNLKGISDLAETLVNANLVETYSLMYLLVKLTLILPVATAIVE